MRGLPFVTCLCLTRNRRQWLPLAIRCFQGQNYPNKEMLIVADGEDVRDLLPEDERIRLIHIEDGRNIGEKRNFGCAQARGEIIAHFDDDDYSAPERLSVQIDMLAESGKAFSGFWSMCFTNGTEWWCFDGNGPNYAIGTSFCYRKSFWQRHPFPAQQVGEDGHFMNAARAAREMVTAPAEHRLIASMHRSNTSPRTLSPPDWHRCAPQTSEDFQEWARSAFEQEILCV